MNHSADDYENVLDQLKRAGVITLLSKKNHYKYRIEAKFARNPSCTIFIAPKTTANWHAGKNLRAVIKGMLKPNVLDEVMGWTHKKVEETMLTSNGATTKLGDLIGNIKLPLPLKQQEKFVTDRTPVHTMNPSVVEEISVSINENEIIMDDTVVREVETQPVPVVAKPVVEPVQVPQQDIKLTLPEKVRVTPANMQLAEICNNYIDGAQALLTNIKTRASKISELQNQINELQAQSGPDQVQFQKYQQFIEQMQYTMMALPDVPLPVAQKSLPPVNPLPAVVPSFNGQQPSYIRPTAMIFEINRLLLASPTKAFSIQEIVDHFKNMHVKPTSDRTLTEAVSHIVSHALNKTPDKVRFIRYGRGLYTANTNDNLRQSSTT